MIRGRACRLAVVLLVAGWTGCGNGGSPESRVVGPPSPQQLADAVYSGIYDEAVQLSEGRYEGAPFVAGGTSRPTVRLLAETARTGDLDGVVGDEAAVLLVEDSGGSGSFIYLAVVGLEGGAPVNLGTALVGDRAKPQELFVENSRR